MRKKFSDYNMSSRQAKAIMLRTRYEIAQENLEQPGEQVQLVSYVANDIDPQCWRILVLSLCFGFSYDELEELQAGVYICRDLFYQERRELIMRLSKN